jgi:peptidoglycan/LPS O-acetylase OafA/YrhL
MVQRIPQLDGLRGIAIGLVLLHHFIYRFHPPMPETLAAIFLPVARLGWSGVDLFFVLSGFLIGGILVDARESDNYYSTFYIRRSFRILPLYLLLVLLGFLLFGLERHGGANVKDIPLHSAPWAYYLTFTQNFFFARHTDTTWYLDVTWSLAVEEQFYLTLPVLVRRVSKEKLLPMAMGLVVFFAVLRTLLYWRGDINPMQCYVLPFCRFDSLFIGVTCALLLRNETCRTRFQKHPRLLLVSTTVFGCSFFLMDHYLWGRNLLLHTAGFTVIGLFYASVTLLILIHPGIYISRVMCYKPLIRLGTLSYCVYLIHGLVLIVIDQVVKHMLGLTEVEMWVAVVASVAATLLIAQGSWVLFESRMIALAHKFAYASRKTLAGC